MQDGNGRRVVNVVIKDAGTDLATKYVPDNGVSVARRDLPPIDPAVNVPDSDGNCPVSLVLFYQYKEPIWTNKEHKKALCFVTEAAKKNGICGRGRCAPEGLNCTLSGSADGIRAFCMALRGWDKIFEETGALVEASQPTV